MKIRNPLKIMMLTLALTLAGCTFDLTSSATPLPSDDASMTSIEQTSVSEEAPSTSIESESIEVSTSDVEEDSVQSEEPPHSSEEEDIEPNREPGIYLERPRIGVAKGQTITIEHEVHPSDLGTVTWELLYDEEGLLNPENYPASVTPEGEVTGLNYFREEEFIIRGTVGEYEVYATLMVFLDYDKRTNDGTPVSQLNSVLGTGNRYHNGTTVYAGLTPAYPVHYFAYDLREGMLFNMQGFTVYSFDRPEFYYEFGLVLNNEFVALKQPFISSDGKALLLSHHISEDGEYIVRVRSHNPISSGDRISYRTYSFWF